MSNWMTRRATCLALILATAAGNAAEQAGGAAASDQLASTAAVAGPEDEQALAAIERAHDRAVIEDLAESGDPADAALSLLLSPACPKPPGVSSNPARMRTDRRWQRVLTHLDQVPVELLAALALSANECLDTQAWARLEAEVLRRDGRDLSAWLYRMGDLRDDPAALDRWLRRALRQVDHFDMTRYAVASRMADAYARHPTDPALAIRLQRALEREAGEAWPRPPTDRERWLIPALGRVLAFAMPSLATLADTCPKPAIEVSPERHALCLRLARHALRGAGSLPDQALLLRIEARMAVTDAERVLAAEDRRRARWLSFHQDDRMSAAQMIRFFSYVGEPDASLLGWTQRRMAEAGIPAEPPSDWQPGSP